MIYNQIVTWTAFAILAMFFNKNQNKTHFEEGTASEEVDISLEEREEKTADVSDIFESQSLLSAQEN